MKHVIAILQVLSKDTTKSPRVVYQELVNESCGGPQHAVYIVQGIKHKFVIFKRELIDKTVYHMMLFSIHTIFVIN